ncbi:MAG: hypothetical protein KIT31_21525 [Deltaproteobacteria bacterium]|nr:hypothetical protein [Deltaproteobacteria bacterium]
MNKLLWLALAASACSSKSEPTPRKDDPQPPAAGSGSTAKPEDPKPPQQQGARKHDQIARPELNRWAVRRNLPVYWIADKNNNAALDPDEVATLLFYPTAPKWVEGGAFTRDFELVYDDIVNASKAALVDPSSPDAERRKLVGEDLDQGRATLVLSDLANLSPADKEFVGHMLKVAALTDTLFDKMTGATAFAPQVAKDPASASLFRRNRSPRCVAPATEKNPACSALEKPCDAGAAKTNPRCAPDGSPRLVFDLYPDAMQLDPKFCQMLEKRPDSKALLDPFTVVRGQTGKLTAVPYHVEYKEQSEAIAKELEAAAASITDPEEKPLVAYLTAAAAGWRTSKWEPADEAWSRMTVDNSKWYVRSAPDEVYWEPCSQKAGVHLTLARIDQGSKAWQEKLVPVQQDMEAAIAEKSGAPYKARKVTFHLPDFIEIVVNAGQDREALSITIGQSLPNWGPVANEGRGRTVAMTNLYTDPDSRAQRRTQAESLLDAASMKNYGDNPQPGLLSTILHEATHNLGPAHEYAVGGKGAPEIFGGPLASIMEELKAQTGALFLVELLRQKGILTDELALQSYVDSIVWAMGHTSRGMYESDGKPRTYSQLAAIQLGFLRDRGALVWDDKATAANGKDKGAYTIVTAKLVPVIDEMMKHVGGIKARGDKAAAEELVKKYVDSSASVPHEIIRERFLRFPKQSFVYSIVL